jgi:hypothetical protein
MGTPSPAFQTAAISSTVCPSPVFSGRIGLVSVIYSRRVLSEWQINLVAKQQSYLLELPGRKEFWSGEMGFRLPDDMLATWWERALAAAAIILVVGVLTGICCDRFY